MSVPDSRVFFKMDVGYFRNPKILPLLEECRDAVFLHMAAIAYSREHLTDGVVPIRRVMADVLIDPCGAQCGSHCTPQCARIVLLQTGLIEQVDNRLVRVHDYGKHNQTADEVQTARAAGQKAAAARWGKKKDADRIPVRNPDRSTDRNAEGNAEERREETSTRAGARAREDRFADFWQIYPKKVAKGSAERAWTKAVKDTDPQAILDALTAQRPALARAEAQFIAHPATWLNGRRWEDEPPRTAGQTGATDTQGVFAGIPRPDELRFHDEDDT